MKCLILAAGYATRLYPLTENFPKPLLKVKDKPIIDWLIDDIERLNKIDEYIVISNHKFIDHFTTWQKNKQINTKITVLDDGTMDNENRIGAVADINLAIETLNINDDLMVLAGDNVLDFTLEHFIKYFEEKQATCVMRYYEGELNKIKKSASVKIDETDLVLEMIEKPENPTSNWCVPPFYIYQKEDVKKVNIALNNGCNKDAPGSFISWLYKHSNVYAMEMPGKRFDIGNIDNYNNINNTYEGILK